MADKQAEGLTATESLKIVAAVAGAVVVLLLGTLAMVGLVAVAVSLGTVIIATAASLLVIYGILRLMSVRFRALVWHLIWLFLAGAMVVLLIAKGHVTMPLIGLAIGAIVAAMIGLLHNEHRCVDKIRAGRTQQYNDASGKVHTYVLLDVSDLPGGKSMARTSVILVASALILLGTLAWALVLNAFGWHAFYVHCLGLISGFVAGYALLTMLWIIWVEHSFRVHVFVQHLSGDAIGQALSHSGKGEGPGHIVQTFLNDIGFMLKELYSVSVRREKDQGG